MKTFGYAAMEAGSDLVPWSFERRAPRANDVVMEILYCGICHSDLHMARNDWGFAQFPLVPDHEIVDRVIEVGSEVTKFKVGDNGAVGCMVDNYCQTCKHCLNGEEQFCCEGNTNTYSSPDRIDGSMTRGGYFKHIVVREEFFCTLFEGLDLARVAPILCAGITTWTPLRRWNVGPGSRVGVIGMGGLGHMAAKLALGLGAHVTMISRSPAKRETAMEIGVDDFLVSTDETAMKAAANSLDLIIDTVPIQHDMDGYVPLLDIDGTLVILGQVGAMGDISTMPLVFGRRRVVGSLIGGMRETQEVIDFCVQKGILPKCRMIRPDEINDAFATLEKSDIPYRFVMDMAALQAPEVA
ncbi:NAD(P)-dependent alcohol dehydrogenase [Breoghania sp.]|uniref:NAD(P)-dependent alcohol dehydrogenase n=1 Tax=Breoghania sp. TaxID=2065378 RepID=UPI002635E0F7|nr:NAD(P)-dependent alcohol dehydrogenase [Breoghania sp.]MDJ0930568.1 NAD(P)-dependent alcohol dehydrogenase [Breoghania sp.]